MFLDNKLSMVDWYHFLYQILELFLLFLYTYWNEIIHIIIDSHK